MPPASPLSHPQRVTAVRTLHTVIYVVMSAGIFAILYAGVTGARGWWLAAALALLAVETVVFAGCGLRCPLTGVVDRYADGARVSDTFFPERFTRHTLHIFGPLLAIGVALVAARFALGRWAA